VQTKEILFQLRTQRGLSQDELAEQMYVTRQAVSRWENGDTIPNTETLKLLSKLFDVSINTLLGAPRQLICQCCGMPLEDSILSHEPDGQLNEAYCQWCYADGRYTYERMEDLIAFCASHMATEQFPAEQVRAYLQEKLPQLDYWKAYTALGGQEKFDAFKQQLLDEINALAIDGLPRAEALHPMPGRAFNPEFTLPNGTSVRFREDDAVYLGAQLPCLFGGSRRFVLIAHMTFLLVYPCEADGSDPQLVLYQKR